MKFIGRKIAKYLVVSICIFSGETCSYAQIDASNLNKQLLEHKIKLLIDSTRLSYQLSPLFNDSILYVASDHHARYMLSKGELSHTEDPSKAFYHPQDRANFYGAPKSYLVGENVAYAPYNSNVRVKGKTFNTYTYDEIARCLVFSWINSKGHFKNIVHPEYQVTGLSIAIDPETQRVYACQKFAQVLYQYSFEENPDFFPYSSMNQDSVNALIANVPKDMSYPFGLRYDKKEKCEECKPVWAYYPPISVRIDRNYFVLRVEDSEFVKTLIKNKHDGFAIELVPFDPFACGNPQYEEEPSRRNGQKRTSGRVLEPVYRNDLIKGFKKRKRVKNLTFVNYLFTADSVSFFRRFGQYKLARFEAKYFEVKLGKVPKDMNSWWNHNLMYIHNKQICHFLFLTNYPGELDLEMLDVPYFPPVPLDDYEFELDHFKDTLELFYEAGETVTTSKEFESLIRKYIEKHVTIQQISIEGFCSVEGNVATNEMLHQQRAQNILTRLQSIVVSDTIAQIYSQVAWDHFYANVKEDSKWKFLYPLSKNEIVAYLNDPTNERPLDILRNERKVKVEITGIRELTSKNANYYIQRDLNKLVYKDSRGKLHCSSMDTLQKIYAKAFYFSTLDTISKADFLKIKLPKVVEEFPHSLDHDFAFYRYHYLKETATDNERENLESQIEFVFTMCGAAAHLSPQFHYLSACLLVDKIKAKPKITADNPDIQKAFNRLNLLLTSYDLDSNFKFNIAKANLNIVNILCETVDPDQIFEYTDIVNASLIHITEFYQKSGSLTPEIVLKLAKLSCFFKNVALAVELCSHFLDDDEVLKLYLPLAYCHTSYLSGDEMLQFERDYHALLLEAKQRLSAEEWCDLFYGNYGIPFQIMDNKSLHEEFCTTCPNRLNKVLEEFSEGE